MKYKEFKLQIPSLPVYLYYSTFDEYKEEMEGLWRIEMGNAKMDNEEGWEQFKQLSDGLEKHRGASGLYSKGHGRIWVDSGKCQNQRQAIREAAHEIMHLVDDIGKRTGIDDSEYRAYLMDYVLDRFMELLDEEEEN